MLFIDEYYLWYGYATLCAYVLLPWILGVLQFGDY